MFDKIFVYVEEESAIYRISKDIEEQHKWIPEILENMNYLISNTYQGDGSFHTIILGDDYSLNFIIKGHDLENSKKQIPNETMKKFYNEFLNSFRNSSYQSPKDINNIIAISELEDNARALTLSLEDPYALLYAIAQLTREKAIQNDMCPIEISEAYISNLDTNTLREKLSASNQMDLLTEFQATGDKSLPFSMLEIEKQMNLHIKERPGHYSTPDEDEDPEQRYDA